MDPGTNGVKNGGRCLMMNVLNLKQSGDGVGEKIGHEQHTWQNRTYRFSSLGSKFAGCELIGFPEAFGKIGRAIETNLVGSIRNRIACS